MKIAILGTRGIPARYGGFETFAEKLAVGLVALGAEVTVYCESAGQEEHREYGGVKLMYQSAPPYGALQTILYDLKCLWSARKGYDVVYMLGYGAAPFCLIPRLWGTQVWINPDGVEWLRAKWSRLAKTYFRWMEWTSVRAADRIIADAGAIAQHLESRHGKLKNCSVIPYGCRVIEESPAADLLLEWGIDPGSYYLVVCRLEPENHVLEIVEAITRSGTSRQLIVVGNHAAQTQYAAALRKLDHERVRFIGTVFDEAKLTALRWHCFGYLHGHSVGGTNPSLLEAMGCGNFIFAHDNPFNRETLGGKGVFFKDSDELARAIDYAEGGMDDVATLRSEVRKRAAEVYSWESVIDQYWQLLSVSDS